MTTPAPPTFCERIICGVAPVFVLLLLGSPVAAQNPKSSDYLRNTELCNGSDPTSLELRISAYTALIDSSQVTRAALAIAHNNRGNAYVARADYDRAIKDFDQSINVDPTYPKPFNNRGVAFPEEGRIRPRAQIPR